MRQFLRLIGIGVMLGIVNVIPGISGGTIAVACNIYDRLIGVITLNVKKILSVWVFWLPLGIGVCAGIFCFSAVMTFVLSRYPLPANWFFIGVIAGSVPLLYPRCIGGGKKTASAFPAPPAAACALVAFAAMLAMRAVSPGAAVNAPESALTPLLAFRLFAGGLLAAVAMIIPGISGSFLLLVFGLYGTFTAAVSRLNVALLIPGGLGVAAGLLLGAGLVRFLLRKVPTETYGAILGLVAGSACAIFPGFGSPLATLAAFACAAGGFALSFFGTARPAKSSK
jgi:putative membrane protein